MKQLFSLLFLLACIVGAVPATASSTKISCPDTQVQASITTYLSSDWGHEPTLQSLQGVDIEEVNGHRFLTCLYGEGQPFKASRPEPLGRTCQVQDAEQNFACELTPARLSGSAAIPENGILRLDLTNGRTQRPLSPDVLIYNFSHHSIVAVRRGGVIKMGRSRSGANCFEPRRGSPTITLGAGQRSRIHLPLHRLTDYKFCVTTVEGGISEFYVNQLDSSPSGFEVSYKIW